MNRLQGWTLAVLLLSLVACSEQQPGPTYVIDEGTDSLLAVPAGWRVYSRAELDEGLSASPYATEGDPILYQVGFSADPEMPVEALLTSDSDTPTGLVQVIALTPEEADKVSNAVLRNALFNVDERESQDPNSIVVFVNEPVSQMGYRGQRMVFSVREPLDAAHPYGRSYTVSQTHLIDPTGSTAYFLWVMCNSDCYGEHEPEIQELVGSWSVVEP